MDFKFYSHKLYTKMQNTLFRYMHQKNLTLNSKSENKL